MKSYLIHPASFKLDGGAMFGIIPKPLWEKKIEADEKNRILMSLRVVYIETAHKKILIDTGIGEYHNEKFIHNFEISSQKNPLISLLAELEVTPEQITDIISTHLHFDHIGGLGSREGEKLFPNATIHMHKKHFEYAKKPSSRDQGSFHSHIFVPLLENHQLNLVDQDQGILIEDGKEKIRFKVSHGHTPYMLHPIWDKYIYMADLVPMSHHVSIPWVMGYDIEPAVTTQYKKDFYKLIQDENLCVIFEHDLETWGGSIIKNDKGRFVLKDEKKAKKDLIIQI